MLRLITLMLLFGAGNVLCQQLLMHELLETHTRAQLTVILDEEMRTGISLYKVTYLTTNINGQPDTASGLVVIPDSTFLDRAPLVAYQHGTTDGPEAVPSMLTGGHVNPMAYGGYGYLVSAQDYLGLGESDGFHPYVHAQTEASAGIDMLIAATELYEELSSASWNGQLFISGYSQGGHAAAALQRELEANWTATFPVTASTPMSGPYSLSGVMFEKVISDEVYYYGAFIVYIVLAYQEVYGNLYEDVGDMFKPQFVTPIQHFYNGEVTLSELATFIITRLFFDTGSVVPREMFRDSVIQAIEDNPDHPLRTALRDNDLLDWVPQSPTRLYYCMGDEVVPFQNSMIADSIMNANGAADVQSEDIDPEAGHSDCSRPAVTASVAFFDGFVLSSSTAEETDRTPLRVYPNPVQRRFTLTATGSHREPLTITLTDLAGRELRQWRGSVRESYSVDDIAPGLYVLCFDVGNSRFSQKIVIH